MHVCAVWGGRVGQEGQMNKVKRAGRVPVGTGPEMDCLLAVEPGGRPKAFAHTTTTGAAGGDQIQSKDRELLKVQPNKCPRLAKGSHIQIHPPGTSGSQREYLQVIGVAGD